MALIELTTNRTLCDLAGFIGNTPVEFDALTRHGDFAIDDSNIPGLYAERHVIYVITQASQTGIVGDVELDPIPEGTETKTYRITRSNTHGKGWHAVTKRDKKARTEYDGLGIADGLAFAVEVKSGKSTSTLKFDDTALRKKFHPLQEYFRTDRFGYLAASPRNAMTGIRLERFKERGGVVVQFPITRGAFRSESLKACKRTMAS